MSENIYSENSPGKSNDFLSAKDSTNKSEGKVLLVTALTGPGYNTAPHFGMYQILYYLHHHNMSCDVYDRDNLRIKRFSFATKPSINYN